MKIRKNDNGNIREFEIKEFVEKLVAKEAIRNTDKIYYCENPQKLCEELNSNEKQFGIRYDVVQFDLKRNGEIYWLGPKEKSLGLFYFANFKNCDIMHLKEDNKYLDLNIQEVEYRKL